MRVRIGDLVIVRFDPEEKRWEGLSLKWNERVGLVIGIIRKEYQFICWNKLGNRTEILHYTLSSSRLTRARPKKNWDGALYSLTLDSVKPI